jgi:MFS family permease
MSAVAGPQAGQAGGPLPFPLFIAGLSLVQIIAWGATFYLPSILERQIGAELGLSREVVFGGVTLMLVIAALAAPTAGRYIDREGAGRTMVAGCLMLAAGLALIGVSRGAASYLVGWAVIGLAVPLAMSVAAFAAVAQAFPERGRAGITTMMLFSGLSSGIIWPITGWLDARYGWRATCLIYAFVQIAICLPIVLAMRPVRPSRTGETERAAQSVIHPRLRDTDRRAAFWLLVVGSGVSGLVTWGLPLYFVSMLTDAGVAAGLAIFLASLQAYATFAARGFDLAFSGRFGGMRLVSGAALLPPVVFVILLASLGGGAGAAQTATIAFAMALYGFAAGLIAAGRATLPLELFGSDGYARTLGNLSLWLNLMFAASPLLFAAVFNSFGARAALAGGLMLSLVAAIAFWRLDRLVVEGERAT